jgi:hypothetical protein
MRGTPLFGGRKRFFKQNVYFCPFSEKWWFLNEQPGIMKKKATSVLDATAKSQAEGFWVLGVGF